MPATTAPKAPLASVRSWMSDATQNRFIAIVLAMLVAVPLLASPATGNLTGAASLAMESFALVLMTMLLWRAKFDLSASSVRQFLTTGANAPVLAFVALVGVSALFAAAPALAAQQFLMVAAGALLYFVVGYQFRQSKHLSMLASVLVFLGGVVAFAGLASYQMNPADRPHGVFGDPQLLGSMLMVLLPIVGSLAFSDKSPARSRVAQFVAVLMVGALLVDQVRIAWVASAASLVTLAVLHFRATAGTKRVAVAKHNLVFPVLFVLIAGGFAATMVVQNHDIVARAASVSNLHHDSSWTTGRLGEWKAAIQMFLAHPFTGVGAGQFALNQGQFTGQGVQLVNGQYVGKISLWDQAHNFYLQTAAELGLPGLLLMVAALGSFLFAGFQRVGTMEAGIRRTLLIGSLAATVGFMVDAVASPSWQFGQVAMFMWLMMGIGTSCFRPRAKAVKVEDEAVAPLRRTAWVSRTAAIALALCVASLLPSFQTAAHADYNDDDTSTGEKVAIGAAAVAVSYIVIDAIVTGGSAAAGGAAAGAGAAGTADAGTVAADGTVVGGAPGTNNR